MNSKDRIREAAKEQSPWLEEVKKRQKMNAKENSMEIREYIEIKAPTLFKLLKENYLLDLVEVIIIDYHSLKLSKITEEKIIEIYRELDKCPEHNCDNHGTITSATRGADGWPEPYPEECEWCYMRDLRAGQFSKAILNLINRSDKSTGLNITWDEPY